MPDEFTVTAPPDWTSIPNATHLIEAWGAADFLAYVRAKEWGLIEGFLEQAGVLPAGVNVAEVRFAEIGEGTDRYDLWVRYIQKAPG